MKRGTESLGKGLARYVPKKAVPLILDHLTDKRIKIVVTDPRSSKLGDHRPPIRKHTHHRISINGDLCPYHFLITLIHEFAHAAVWETYGRSVAPHGKEWKGQFKKLMAPYLEREDIFPEGLRKTLSAHMENPPASCFSDPGLIQALRANEKDHKPLTVGDIPQNTVFVTRGGRIFRKGEKARKRFKCEDIQTGRPYMVHPLAEVISLKNAEERSE